MSCWVNEFYKGMSISNRFNRLQFYFVQCCDEQTVFAKMDLSAYFDTGLENRNQYFILPV